MSSGIYYNQEVTAEMLNGIAADLGHTSFNGFGDEKFGADALNDITKDLVNPGVLLTGNKCRVIRDSSNNIILQTGIIVFANGAKKEIEEPIIVDADNGTVIFAYNNIAEGVCTIEVAESYPTEGDFIKLCTVGTDGSLMDDRVICSAKVALMSGNTYIKQEFNVTVMHNGGSKEIARYSYDMWDKFTYISINSYIIPISEINFGGLACSQKYGSYSVAFFIGKNSADDSVVVNATTSDDIVNATGIVMLL